MHHEVFWGTVLNIYTHPLEHVSTGPMHQAITVEGSRFVTVLSSWVTSFHCWQSPKAAQRDPKLVHGIQSWLQRERTLEKSAAANRSAPSASKLPLAQLAPAVVGTGGELAEGCGSRYVEAGRPSRPAVLSAEAFLGGVQHGDVLAAGTEVWAIRPY